MKKAIVFALALFVGTAIIAPKVEAAIPTPVSAYALGDVTHILGNYVLFPYGFRAATEYQSAPCQFACRQALVAGVTTWTFASGQYSAAPVCTASEESSTGHYLKITAISATSVTFTSDVTTANTDNADMRCTAASTT